MSMVPHVCVVDDDPKMREALTLLLASAGIASQPFASAESFLDAVSKDIPVCGLVDVRLPGMSGIELLGQLADRNIDAAIIVISGHGDVPMAVAAMKAGAVHFVEKPFDPELLLELVDEARRRTLSLAEENAACRSVRVNYETLTARECEVMALLVDGLPNKLVAARLGISTRTAEHHRQAIMRKMHARTLSHLFKMALRLAGKPV